MAHYDFPASFRKIYDHAVVAYRQGQRNAASMFSPEQLELLRTNGISAQHLYDYAEDDNNYGGEPGFEHALGIELIRRDYFLNVQGGRPSGVVLDEAKLPAKTDAARGIEWLPRLIPKTKAKLRGELPASLMYCCGGDRKFLKAHDILPSEFLNLVWRNENNDEAIIDWVVRRTGRK